jgi:hypothetical protein
LYEPWVCTKSTRNWLCIFQYFTHNSFVKNALIWMINWVIEFFHYRWWIIMSSAIKFSGVVVAAMKNFPFSRRWKPLGWNLIDEKMTRRRRSSIVSQCTQETSKSISQQRAS